MFTARLADGETQDEKAAKGVFVDESKGNNKILTSVSVVSIVGKEGVGGAKMEKTVVRVKRSQRP
ncbi:MAG: hypothetical protein MUO68_20480 [Desulfobacteraceae bacterium]|nr:hypothetical protein [Desulfobacteraceae bacterium]